jgi:hypothetical protein
MVSRSHRRPDGRGSSSILKSRVSKKIIDMRFYYYMRTKARLKDIEEVRSLVFHAFFLISFLSFRFLDWRVGV